jgi:hypothetical protein
MNPMLLLIHLVVSTILLLYVAAIHATNGWLNIFFKMLFTGSALVGVVLTLKQAGLI